MIIYCVSGHYLMFNNSKDRQPGIKAMLISPWYGSSGPNCSIKFYINVDGKSLGGLHLYVHTGNTGIKTELWKNYKEFSDGSVLSVVLPYLCQIKR